MSDGMKLTMLLLFTGLMAMLTILTIIFVVVPRDQIIQGRVEYEVSQIKIEVNECNDAGGSAYVLKTGRVFCERVSHD